MWRFGPIQRRLAAFALFAGGAATGAVVLPAFGVFASPFAAGNASGSQAILIQNSVAALETRVAGLEDLVATHIGAEGLVPPKEGGLVLRAPLTILGASGNPILSITADGDGGKLTLGDPGGNHFAEIGATADKSLVAVHSGEAVARIETDGVDAFASMTGGSGDAVVGQSEFGWGLFLNSKEGQPAAELAQPEGKSMALRVYDKGSSVTEVGSVPGQGGAVRVFSSSADVAAVSLDAKSDGTGQVEVHAADGELAAELNGKERAVTAHGSDGIAVLGKSNDGFGLFLKNRSGAPTADLSQPSGLGMALRVYQDGKQVAFSGAIPGEGGSVRIFSPSAEIAAASLSTNSDGSGTVVAFATGGERAVVLDGEKKALVVKGESGTATLGAHESGWGLFLGDKSDQPTAEIAQPEGKGMALRVYDKGQSVAEVGAVPGAGGSVRIFSPTDQQIFTVGMSDQTAEPELVLGVDSAARLQLGVLKGSSGGYVSFYDDAGKERGVISADASHLFLSLNDSEMHADVGTPPEGRMGFTLGKDDKSFVRLGFDETGGFLTVSNKAGKGVAGVQSDPKGGAVIVAGPEGGVTIGKLASGPDGGALHLWDASGKERISASASQTGDITLFGAGGALAMTSGEVSPSMDISDPAGTVLFKAYVTKSGLGAVSVGPAGNGAAATLGNAGLPASALLGKK